MTNPDETNGGVPEQTDASIAQAPPASMHDTLFYKLMSDPERAAAILRSILSEPLVKAISWSTLKPEPGRFVDPNMRNHYADVWLSVKVRGKKVVLHVLFEHSSGPKNHELLQALRYQVRYWEKQDTPPNEDGIRALTPILTVILHHSESGWRGRTRFADYFGLDDDLEAIFRPYMVDFGVFVDDLSPLPAEVLLARPVPVQAQVLLFALRFGRSGQELIDELPKVVPLMQKLLEDPRGRLAVKMVIVYLGRVAKVPEAQLRMALQDVYEPLMDPELSALWDRYEEGRKIAREAERRGIVKGQVGTLEQLLMQRFGPLPAPLPAHAATLLKQATKAQLDEIQLRVLTAATLEETLGVAKKVR